MRSDAWLLGALLACAACAQSTGEADVTETTPTEEDGSIEPEYSFHMHPEYKTTGQVPGWRLWGNATLVDYSVVLTSGYPGHPEAGAIWNPKRIDFVEWELRIVFNTANTFNGGWRGGDGFTVYYAKELVEHSQAGSYFGASDSFSGLAIAFDSWDDDGQEDNPSVNVVLNDGYTKYDQPTDGAKARRDGGTCKVDYRHAEHAAVFRIRYINHTVRVDYDLKNKGEYITCAHISNVKLSKSGFIGVVGTTTGADKVDRLDVYGMYLSTFLSTPGGIASRSHRLVDQPGLLEIMTPLQMFLIVSGLLSAALLVGGYFQGIFSQGSKPRRVWQSKHHMV